MKIYSLILLADECREIRSFNTGNPRADLTAALELAEGYVRYFDCAMMILCNNEIVWESR
jgi:hypothetical protein